MNQGIFGGSFDPPHEGHRRLAQSAFASLRLDRLFWVPTQDPPHKPAPGTPFPDRLEMVRLAIAGLTGHEASGIEAGLAAPNYSLYTIRALKAMHARAGDAWYFLIGADNWAIFPQWHKPSEVLEEVTLAVYPREGSPLGPLPAGVKALSQDLLPGRSSDIRSALARGETPASAGVLPEIRDFIAAHGLYAPGKKA